MQIIEASACQCREEDIDCRKSHSCLIGHLQMTAEKHHRDHTRGKNYRLTDLQCQRRGEDHVEGKQQIIYRRYMYSKVRQQSVALAGYIGQQRLLHVEEHVAEDTKVKIRCAVGQITK